MSRDQKPGRSDNVASAPSRTIAAAPVATPPDSSELSGTPKTAGKLPVALLATVFILASVVGGISVALLGLLT